MYNRLEVKTKRKQVSKGEHMKTFIIFILCEEEQKEGQTTYLVKADTWGKALNKVMTKRVFTFWDSNIQIRNLKIFVNPSKRQINYNDIGINGIIDIDNNIHYEEDNNKREDIKRILNNHMREGGIND